MKQEASKKKSKLWLWLVIGIVALLAVVGVVLALVLGGGSGDEGPQGGRPELYWNVDRKAYTEGSSSGLSTREPGEDGTYKVRFAINGELVEMPVADKRLINYIDTLDAMGLVLDADGVVVDVKDPKDIATEINKNAYVKNVTGDTIVANTSVAMNGMVVNVKLEDITEIYDVTPDAEVPGQIIQASDLKDMDTLCIYANDLDQVTHIYVTSHPKESKVYWRAEQQYNSKEKATAREPDENGAYSIDFFCDGERVTLKTKDKSIATKVDSTSRWKCHFGFTFDEEGYITEYFNSALGISALLATDAWDVVAMDGDYVTIQRLTTNDGSVWEGTVPADCVIYDASYAALSEGRQGKQVDSLQVGDRVTVWTDPNGTPILIYIGNRIVDVPACWVPSRKYNATLKETKREIGPSGYYEVELVPEGGPKQTYYIKDKETMSYLDSISQRCVGVKADGNNIVEYVYHFEALTGYTCATQGGCVTAVTGSVFTKISIGKPDTAANLVLAAGARLYNVSQYGEMGEETTLQPGDHIYGFRQPTGEILVGFVTKRAIGGEHMYWRLTAEYDSENKVTTREPDTDGWYYIDFAYQGKQVTLKTKDKALVTKIDALSIGATALSVSGDVITNVYDATYPYSGQKVASGYRYRYITDEGKYHCVYSSDATKTAEFKMADDCVIYNVSTVFDEFQGERIYSIPYDSMLTVFCDIYGEAKVVYVRQIKVDNMYWKTETLYDSTNKVTKRTPDENGYYWYTLAVNGECKTFKTKDQSIANSMDSYSGAFGLNVKGDEILGFVSTSGVKNVNGNGINGYCVTAINGNKVTLTYNKPGSSFGKTQTITLSSGAKIYDVTPSSETFGAAIELKVGDTVRTYLSSDGETHNYVYVMAHSTRKGGEVGYCEVCKKEVTWNPLVNSVTMTKADGHWYVTQDMTAYIQQTHASTSKDYTICLDLNGHTLTRSENGRMFRISEGETLNIMDSVGGGKVVGGGGTSFNGGLIMMSAGGKVNMYGGTLEFVQGEYKNGYGGVVYMSGAGTQFNLYDGVITGGVSCAQNKDKPGYGGNFYIGAAAELNMYGGEISGGKAYGMLAEYVDSKGAAVYKAVNANGGNIYLTESSMVNIYGGVVKDGEAVRESFKYTVDGEEKSLTNMSFGGNIFKLSTNKLNGRLYIENATISGGKAHRGGNINANASSGGSAGIVVLKNATVIDGVATQFGGNIMSNCATWSITGSKILNGQCINNGAVVGNGGNIYSQGGEYVLENTTVSGGKAANGGNIDLYKNKTDSNVFVVGEGTVIENGVATGVGGNINVQDKNYVDVNGNVMEPDEDVDGIGTPLLPTLSILGGEIKGGQAGTGNNIYCAGHMTVKGGTVTDGNIFFTGANEATLSLLGGEVDDEFSVKGTAEFLIAGDPVIANLSLDKKVTITVDKMTAGADIKVSTNAGTHVFTESFDAAKDYVGAAYFTAYDPSQQISVTQNNQLVIKGADLNGVYEQAKAMDFSDGGVVEAECPICHKSVEWEALPANNTGKSLATVESGHYYLSSDIDYTKNNGLYNFTGKQVCINLNGQNLTSTVRAFYTEKVGSVLNLMGDGVVTGVGYMSSGNGFGVLDLTTDANICGGTYISTGDGPAIGNRKTSTGDAVVSIYNGTEVVNNNANGLALYVRTNGSLEICGGTVDGKVLDSDSKGITVSGQPTIDYMDLTNGTLLNVGLLENGASIKVNALGEFTTEIADAEAAKEFFSVAEGMKIVVTGQTLSVIRNEALVCPHCGLTEEELEAAGTPWTEWDFPTSTKGAITSGHYYLTENIDMDKQYYIGTSVDDDTNNLSVDVVLDLRGCDLQSPSRVFYGYTNNHLTLLDSVGGGIVQGGLATSAGGTVFMGDGGGNASLNLYNITVKDGATATRDKNGGVLFLSGNTSLVMEDCVLNGGTASAGGSIFIGSGEVQITDTTISGGTAAKGGDIYLSNGTVNLTDSSVGTVWVNSADGSIVLNGAAVIEELDLTQEDALITVGELTADASVTVVADGVFTNALTDAEAVKGHFHSGVSGKKVIVDGDTLAIGVEASEPDGPSVYEQAKAMDFSAGGTVNAVCPVCGTEVDWVELPAPTGSSKSQLAAGHYYVADDMEVTTYWYIANKTNGTVCVNLNGKSITNTVERVLYAENKANVLNIMGEGTVIGVAKYTNPTTRNYTGVLDICTAANLYGGTYCSSTEYPVVANRGSGTHSVLNIYEGTKIVRTSDDTAGLNLFIADNATVNMYGGLISGGTAIGGDDETKYSPLGVGKSGGNVLLKANLSDRNLAYTCSFNLFGGVVENGIADDKGGNIAVVGNDLSNPKAIANICGGTVANGSVYATGANASVNLSGDPVVDHLDMAGANLVNVADMTEGASIKVAVAEGVAFTNQIASNADVYAQYFYGEGQHIGAVAKDNVLQLAALCPHCDVALSEITWKELRSNADNTAITMAESGHYKLVENLDSTGNTITFYDSTKDAYDSLNVVIDTCGFNIDGAGRAVYVNKGHTLTIFDSVGGSQATSRSESAALGGSGIYVHNGAVCNIYDLTVYGSPDTHGNGGCLSVYGTDAVLNIYSGAFYGNDDPTKAGKMGGVLYNRAGTVNIYGGTFGTVELAADAKGDCIYNAKRLNIYGGEFAGEIYIETGAEYTVAEDLELSDKIVVASTILQTLAAFFNILCASLI